MAKNKDFFSFNKAINWNKLKDPKILKELEKIFEEKKLTSERANLQASRRDDMKKYRVKITFDEMIIEAEDEEDAQAQAVDLADFGNADIDVEEDKENK